MKSLRFTLLVVWIAISTAALAQSDPKAVQPEAQKSFDTMKTLAGTWEGPTTVDMEEHGKPERLRITLRVTSRGHALVHEIKTADKPDDPARYDHPVTMFYIDSDRLILTHYCDAGNRPSMVGKVSPDGKKVEFDFLQLSGSNEHGHMYHAVFTIIDANHHIEDWTYLIPGDKPVHAHMDLQRVKPLVASR